MAAVEEAVDSHLLEVSKASLFSPWVETSVSGPLDLCLLQSAVGVTPADVDFQPLEVSKGNGFIPISRGLIT